MKITILYFYSDSPGPCRIQNPLIEDLKLKFRRGVEFKKINIDENKALTEKYEVDEVPAIIIECEGKETERFNGLTQEIFLKRAIEKTLSECR